MCLSAHRAAKIPTQFLSLTLTLNVGATSTALSMLSSSACWSTDSSSSDNPIDPATSQLTSLHLSIAVRVGTAILTFTTVLFLKVPKQQGHLTGADEH